MKKSPGSIGGAARASIGIGRYSVQKRVSSRHGTRSPAGGSTLKMSPSISNPGATDLKYAFLLKSLLLRGARSGPSMARSLFSWTDHNGGARQAKLTIIMGVVAAPGV